MRKNTSILLGEHFDTFVSQEVATGKYTSVSEVIRTALRLLETEEQKTKKLLAALEVGEKSKMTENFNSKKHLKELHKKHL
ncbi:MAG: type II toxin-antitoxin system ParD family antitoxin [Bacteroidia bacterium]